MAIKPRAPVADEMASAALDEKSFEFLDAYMAAEPARSEQNRETMARAFETFRKIRRIK